MIELYREGPATEPGVHFPGTAPTGCPRRACAGDMVEQGRWQVAGEPAMSGAPLTMHTVQPEYAWARGGCDSDHRVYRLRLT
jgi:hypothetical protein